MGPSLESPSNVNHVSTVASSFCALLIEGASPGRQATAKHDRDSPRRTGAASSTTEGPSKQARGAPNTTPVTPNEQGERQTRHLPDPNVILSTLWDVKRSTPQRKKKRTLLWYYLFRLRREGTASPGGAARDSRRGLTLDGAIACDKQTGPARPWQTGRSLSNDGNARSLCLGFRV